MATTVTIYRRLCVDGDMENVFHRFQQLSRYTFTENVIKLYAAVLKLP